MANIFANTANLLLTALFFHPLLPLSIPIAFVGFVANYWAYKYIFLRRIKRPEQMSGLMASFFANLLPEIAFVWTLSLALFYRRIYADMPDVDGGQKRVIPQWITLGVVCLFILLPIRTAINRCFQNQKAESVKPYDEAFSTFTSDYDQENPVTKRDGFLRAIDLQLALEKDEQKKKMLEQEKMAIGKSSIAQAFSQYN